MHSSMTVWENDLLNKETGKVDTGSILKTLFSKYREFLEDYDFLNKGRGEDVISSLCASLEELIL